ncbi:hypothetical protein PAEPH01_0860 [Pancytospora epiphaga]|nr:hypothetical protein PAEPH01_0860 [Pancytospora epiphaga]
MENFSLRHCEATEDGHRVCVVGNKQIMDIKIGKPSESEFISTNSGGSVINNIITVTGDKNSYEQFTHEILLHHALNKAEIVNYSVIVSAQGSFESLEIMKGILLAFNAAMNTKFSIEENKEFMKLLYNGNTICQVIS